MPDENPRKLRGDEAPAAPGAQHYREIAGQLRGLAQQCRFPRARLELVQLAITFEKRAEHFCEAAERALSS